MQSTRNDNDAHPITIVLPTMSDVNYAFPATATSSNVKTKTPTKALETTGTITTPATAVNTTTMDVNTTTIPGNKPKHVTLGYAKN